MITPTVDQTNFSFPGQTNLYHGKVRDVYTIDNRYVVMVATDRISAFDVVLPRLIPLKGQVLNQMAAYFLQATADIAPNWLISTPDPNVSIGKKLEPFKIELIVRGNLVGSAWRAYEKGSRSICGAATPDNLREYDAFPEPIITPTSKADEGHDQDITLAEIVEQGLATQSELDQICDYSRQLFARGQDMAAKRNLLLADTKYEFGKDAAGKIYVIDEVHTPDSSRYFYLDQYKAYLADRTKPTPRHLSKEYVRKWLMDNSFSGQAGQTPPKMSDQFVDAVSEFYIGLFQDITGQDLHLAGEEARQQPAKRIEAAIRKALGDL